MSTEASPLTYLRAVAAQFAGILGTYRALLSDRLGFFLLLFLAVLASAVLDSLGIALVMPLVAALQGEEIPALGLSRFFEWLNVSFLAGTACLVAAVYVVKNAVVLVRTRASLSLFYEAWQRWIDSMIRNVLTAPVAAYENQKPGALLSVALTHTTETTIGLRLLLDLAISISTLLATYVVLWVLSWRATAVLTVVLVVFAFAVFRPLSKAAHKAGVDFVAANKTASSTFLEILGGIRYVKAYRQEDRFRDRMTLALTDLKASIVSASWTGTLIHPVVETAVVLIFCAAIVVSAGAAPESLSPLSDELPFLGVLVAAAFRLFPVLSVLGSQWVGVISKQSSAAAVLSAIEPREPEASGTRAISEFSREIVVDRVSYRYPGRAPALVEATLHIPRGSRTAIVGESGSGKSTLVSLLLGFLKPQSGGIWIDGVSLEELRLEDWRRRLGYVGQEGFVFNATLSENVTLGRLHESDPRVKAALEATGLDDVVSELPKGLDTLVGERGVELSGGQRQRVAIARAILLGPDVLLLDEATSALDNEASFAILEAIDVLLPETTLVAVAHRLGSTARFDRIYVVRSGRVVEEGTHSELMSLDGYYLKLFNHERTPEPRA
jgi:ABC-type multidrug transport system fused ATPase/permease subunit